MPDQLRDTIARAADEPAASGEWSPHEVLAHIRATDAIQAAQIFVLAVTDAPYFPGVDERNLAELAGFVDEEVDVALDRFAARRRELVGLLERLEARDWERPAVHEAWGDVNLRFYVEHIVEHETEHLDQIASTIG